MRVLFLHLQRPRGRLVEPHFPIGTATLVAVCRAHGHEAFFHAVAGYDASRLQKRIERVDPHVVCVTASSHRQPTARRIAHLAGIRLGRPVVMGGVHPSVAPDDALSTPGVSAICRGEGEQALPEWLQRTAQGLDASHTPNFWTKLPSGLVRTQLRPADGDLDALPFPERRIIPFQAYLDRYHVLELEASRGWPFRGGLSANPSIYLAYPPEHRPVRHRSVDRLLEEIDALRSRYRHIRQIRFQDACFGADRAWLEAFADRYARQVRLPFICTVAADQVDRDLAVLLRQAGCLQVRVGVESGSEFISHEVLTRRATNDQIVRAFGLLRQAGLQTWAFSLIGLPYESEITIEQTLALNRRLQPDLAQVDVFVPLPGTRAYELCRQEGWLDRPAEDGSSALRLPSLPAERLAYYRRVSRWRIMHPRLAPVIDWLCRVPVWRRHVLYDLLNPLWARLARRPRQQVLAGLHAHLATL